MVGSTTPAMVALGFIRKQPKQGVETRAVNGIPP